MAEANDIDVWLRPIRVFHKGRLQEGMAVGLFREQIAAVAPVGELPWSAKPVPIDCTVTPGFVDLQVNGGGGVLLNAQPTQEAIQAIAAAHRRYGTTAILPTVITDRADVLEQAVDAAVVAFGSDGILGLHIEGPHISVDRRGTHKAEYVRPIDGHTFDQVAKLRSAGVPTLITLAPDVVAPKDIRRLADMGAVVSIGHTKATADVVDAALDAGATCFTHLYNAMPPMAGRDPGVVGAAINSTASVGIICDGIHVNDQMVGLAIRARPVQDKMFLVSDAMPTVGGPEEFDLYGTKVRLVDDRLVNSEGSLAGAHTTIGWGVERLVRHIGVSAEDALRMAITVPGSVIGHEAGNLERRKTADVVCLDKNLAFTGYLADLLSDLDV